MTWLQHWRAGLIIALLVAVWHFSSQSARRGAELVEQAESFKASQANAQQSAQAALAHQEAAWRLRAQIGETNHAKELAEVRDAADRYIADHRVRPQAPQGPSRTAATPAESLDTGLRAAVPASGVLVSEQDVQACTAVTAYALSLRDWVLTLNDPSAAQ